VSGRGRILTVSNFFDTHRGGLEIVAGRLARELAARGFEVTWLASDATPPPEACAARGLATASFAVWNAAERRLGVPWPLLSPAAIRQLWRAVREADAVLLHDSLYMTSIVTFLAARASRTPLVIVQHIGAVPYRSRLLRGLMALANRLVARPVLAGAGQVVFISQFVRDYFAGLRYRRPPELVFNGVDTAVFRPASPAERAAARARFGFAEGERIALFVGRFVEKKGVARLRRLAAQRPDLTFAFAGWGVIDPAAWRLPNVQVFSDLGGPSLAELYRGSDVFVLPSQGEGFPLVVQEALACGLAVVCGDESTGADAEVAPFLTGVDVTGPDADAAVRVGAAIDAALRGDAPELAVARAAFVQARYAWSAAADRYARLLDGLIADRQAAGR
jgi:glycosyltransferase involved in cell wall biosynthesis